MDKVLSISVAAYNMEKYITDTLDSILNSENKELVEIIVVDDGSTDNTSQVVKKYVKKYPSIVKLIKQKNQGPGSTFNAALSKATGKYIKMIDADDFVNSDCLDYFINAVKDIDVDLIITNMDYYDDVEKKVYYTTDHPYKSNVILDVNEYNFIPQMNSISYKTELLKNINLRLDNGFYTDMEYVIIPLPFIKNFIFINNSLYVWRTGRDGQSTSIDGYQKHCEEHFFIFRKLMNYFNDNYDNICDTVRHSIYWRLFDMALMQLEAFLSFEEKNNIEIRKFRDFIKSVNPSLYNTFYEELLTRYKVDLENDFEEYMQPLISIIVPFYNVEDYLERCLDSIVNQTYKNLEIILVNDGSTDSSLDICKRYFNNDSRIKIVNKKHGGVSSSRNAGLDAVTGDYIGFVDSDDYIDENMYMELYNALIENNCDIATCYFYRVYGDEFYTDDNFEFDKIIFNREDAMKSILLDKELRVYLWTKLYSKKVFDNVRFPINREYEDVDVSISTLENIDKVVFINKMLYFYVRREFSIDSNYNDKNVKDSLEMTFKRYKHVKDTYNNLSLYNVVSMITRIVYTFDEMKDKDKIKEYLYIIKEVNDDVNLLDKNDIFNKLHTYFIEMFNYINDKLELYNYI